MQGFAVVRIIYPLPHTHTSTLPDASSGTHLAPLPDVPSKLSLFTAWRSPQALEFVRRARPPVIKVMDEFGLEDQVKAFSPHTVVVGRAFEGQQTSLGQGDPVEAARAFFRRQVDKYRTYRGVDYWEGWNEPSATTAAEMTWYATFEAERVRLLAEIGCRACIGNFPVGSPGNLDLWPYFFPALRAAKQNHGLLGLHEYGWPWMDNYFGKNQINPGEDEGDTGWTTGRYRKIYRAYLIPHDLALPLAITECGLDTVNVGGADVRYREAPQVAGWKNYGAWWAQHGGLSDPVEEYRRQLAWYDSLLRADDYVIGAAIFQLGIMGWEGFDIAGPMVERLTQYGESQLEGETPAAPPAADAPPDPPSPPRGQPREQYARVYILLSPTASAAMAQAAARRFFGPRCTIGYSADDAGIGDLDARTIIAIDPEAWGGDLRAWFAQHYPGVRYQTLRSSEL